MRRKVVSSIICAMMILSSSVSIIQNVGEPENVGQPQNNEQPSPTSGGSEPPTDSLWAEDDNNTGHSGPSSEYPCSNPIQLEESFSIVEPNLANLSHIEDHKESPSIMSSGSGTKKVLLYYGNGGAEPGSFGNSVTFYDLQSYYNGTGYPTTYSSTWPVDLNIYKVIFFIMPGDQGDSGVNFFTSSQINEIKLFLGNGKRLVVMGDHSGSFGVNTVNNLLTNLGVGISQNSDNVLGYVEPAVVDITYDQLTKGVGALDMDGGGVSSVTFWGLAKSLVRDSMGHDLVAVDQIPSSPSRPGADVLVFGDTQVLDNHQLRDSDGDGPYDNYVFADNIVNFNGDNQPPTADAGPDQTVNEGDVVQFNGTNSFNPLGAIGMWAARANIPSPRSGGGSAVFQNEIYYIGGGPGDMGTDLSDIFQKYTPSTDSWSDLPNLPQQRTLIGAATVNGKIYTIGGEGGYGTRNTTYMFDPATNTWTEKAPMPIAMAGYGIAVVDNCVYTVGGISKYINSTLSNIVFEYNTVTDTWSQKSNMPTARAHLAATTFEGKIYAIGGATLGNIAPLEVYDPATDTWTIKTPSPTYRWSLCAEALGNKIFVFGGSPGGDLATNINEVYDPATDTWTTIYPMLDLRQQFGSGVVSNCIYAVGGNRGWMCGHPRNSEKLGFENELIYEWDFDADVDSNGDGNTTNDIDATGPTPTHIYGDNGVYDITLTVRTSGEGGSAEKVDQDAIFCADTSGSMTLQAIDLMKEGLSIYVDEMINPDQGAVVLFGVSSPPTQVLLMNPLTGDYPQLKNDIANIPRPTGSTPMGEALELAIDELLIHGKPNHFPVIILLTDGQWNGFVDPIEMANIAGASNITIYTIGLEPAFGILDEATLIQIASLTDGRYFYAPDALYLKDIYREIAELVEYPGGPPQQDSDTMQVTVNNVAPTLDAITIQGGTERLGDLTEEWVARYYESGDGMDIGKDVAVDSYGNIYVTGFCNGIGPSEDYTTIKYDPEGNELWVALYNGPGSQHDRPKALILDHLGNAYVTGHSKGNGTSNDFATIKYDLSGNELWVARYNGPGNSPDYGKAIAIDTSGIIYVTGTSDEDITTVAYDSDGNEIWVARYDGPVNSEDTAQAIAFEDSSRNIYVTGSSKGSGTDFDYVTIKYDSDGNELWVVRYNGPGNGPDYAVDMEVDSSGNAYVTGQSEGSGTDSDYATIKYDPNGNSLWVRRYNGPGNLQDSSNAITLDINGIIYVTGNSEQYNNNPDYATIAYDSSGYLLWVGRYNGPGNGPDYAYDITTDTIGNVYVSGFSRGSGTFNDVATIVYNLIGDQLWIARYNGPGNAVDVGYAITVDSSQNVYVVGCSWNNSTTQDITTIKYSSSTDYECDEGSSVTFSANSSDLGTDDLTFTWNWGDGTPDTVTTYYNDGMNPEPSYDSSSNDIKSPWGTFPFIASDTVNHTYGDDGVYTITLTVEDDDGGITVNTEHITVINVAPSIDLNEPFSGDEGSSISFSGTASDPGSDDLTFTWEFELGPTISNIYYNDGVGLDPYPSPLGTFPFSMTDAIDQIYGDNGVYYVLLTVTDDDGGSTTINTTFTVNNVAPSIEPFGPFIVSEGTPININAISTDPGSDDLTFTWEFELEPTITNLFYNDGTNPDLSPSPLGTYPFSVSDAVGHTYGDDGNYSIVLTVTDDDGGVAVYETYVIVNNVPPSITFLNYTIVTVNEPRTIGYWGHQCEVMEPYGDHTGILLEWVDEISSQSQVFSWISTKEDVCDIVQDGDAEDMEVMARRQLMGVWLNIESGKLHPQSEIYMPNLTVSKTAWETVEEIEYVILHSTNRTEMERVKNIADNINNGRGIALAYLEFEATATDPGSDDLTFQWDFGDGKSEDHFYPNVNGTFPVEVTDFVGHSYFALGTFDVILTVSDDDGGTTTKILEIVIS